MAAGRQGSFLNAGPEKIPSPWRRLARVELHRIWGRQGCWLLIGDPGELKGGQSPACHPDKKLANRLTSCPVNENPDRNRAVGALRYRGLWIYIEFQKGRGATYDDRRWDLGSKLCGALEVPSVQHLHQDVTLVGSQRPGHSFSLRLDPPRRPLPPPERRAGAGPRYPDRRERRRNGTSRCCGGQLANPRQTHPLMPGDGPDHATAGHHEVARADNDPRVRTGDGRENSDVRLATWSTFEHDLLPWRSTRSRCISDATSGQLGGSRASCG